ncbi:MAG: carboxypeptidase M32 [Patescibacteria group bacterium]
MQKNKKESADIVELKKRLDEVSHLNSAVAILSWDQEVNMPKKGSEKRAGTIAHLSSIVHKKFTVIDHDGLLTKLKHEAEANKLDQDSTAIILETWKSYERQVKLPDEFVWEMAELASKAQTVWAQARKENNFKLFQPYLEKIIEMKRQEAKYIGFKDSPYDALIDAFEPNMTAREAAQILNDLKDFLVPFLAEIKKKKKKINAKKILGKFPIPEQFEFSKFVAQKMGYDMDAGRIDISSHPFATNFHSQDVRFTTRYNEKNVLEALGATIHETGHALYEQGILSENFGTPLGEAISLGIHESQSRLWENMIGKSKPFWKFLYPKLQKAFPKPFKSVSVDEFYEILNKVESSLIRIEADEITYNLHIIIRFEIERELVEGTLEVKDAPKVWNQKYKDYLGIDVPDNARGILQDVHWSGGGVGYFPTYSFGNLYAAQFFNAMRKDIPDLDKKVAKGDLLPLREWLRAKIHAHGKRFTAASLVQEVTGEPLNAAYFSAYIKEKFGKLYGI